MIELTLKDRKAIWDLSEQWKDAANQLKNWEFDYDGFKAMAKQTYSVSPEASAAQLLAETLGDPENLFGILGDNYEVAPDGERELWMELYDPADDDFHKCQIDTETFDLTPLVELMQKTGNY